MDMNPSPTASSPLEGPETPPTHANSVARNVDLRFLWACIANFGSKEPLIVFNHHKTKIVWIGIQNASVGENGLEEA